MALALALLTLPAYMSSAAFAQLAPTASVPARQSARSDGFGTSDHVEVTLKPQLGGQGSGEPSQTVRVVEVKGLGLTSEEAQRDAARQAVQQVAGLYIDARRRVESEVSDKTISDVIQEKILSYTNAYLLKLEVISAAKQPDGLIVVEVRATVIVAPLVKALQASNIPTVAFDTATAIGQVEVSAREKQSAIDLYADLVKRSANLINLSVGAPTVDTSLQAPVDKSWLRIPLTFSANGEALKDWRSKIEIMATKHMSVQMPVKRQAINEPYNAPYPRPEPACVVPVFDATSGLNHVDLQERFLGTDIPLDQHAVTTCFAQSPGSPTVDCFGRIFPSDARPSARVCQGPSCLSLGDMSKNFGFTVELLDASGEIIHTFNAKFSSFPQLNIEGSSATPPARGAGFLNFCVPDQDKFYAFQRYFSAYGDVLILPAPKSRVRAYGNALVANDIIARTASVRAHIVGEGVTSR